MRVAIQNWNNLSPFVRGTLVAFAVALLLGAGVAAVLERVKLPLYLDDLPSFAPVLVWAVAIAAGLVEALRRGGR